MKSFIFLFIVLAVSSLTLAQPQAPDTLWTKTYGGNSGDYGNSVQQTTDGGFIIAGYTYSYGAGYSDVYLIKTDGLGNQQWYRTFGRQWDDYGYSVQQTTDGGFIIAGRTSSYGAANYDVYLIKTDGLGNQQWYRTFGGNNYDCGYSVQQTTDGGFIIAGSTGSYGAGSDDVYLIKTDGLGNQQWYRTFGGNSYDYGLSVQQTTDGGFIIAGYTGSYGAGDYDVYLIKTDGQGNQQWYCTFGGNSYDYGNSVQQTTDGGFIIAGSTYSYGAGSSDVYLIKTDGQGNQQWYRTFGGNNSDEGNSVQQTADGEYVIVGMTYSYDIWGGDVYLIRTDAGGNQQWYEAIGGDNLDYGYSVQQTVDGGYIIAGATSSYGAGGTDVYLIKVESETEQLSISLTPINPPIIIPAGGGSFQFTIDIDNLGIGATVFDAWTNVSVPGIAVPINLLQRSNILLPSGGNINRTLNQFVPGNAPAGTYTYRGFVGEYPNYIVDCDSFTFEKSATGNGYYSGTEWIIAGWDNENIIVNNIPSKISLLKSSPNPFNSKTKISFALPNGGMVSLVIYDITGKEIVKLSEGWKTTGSYEIDFDGSDMTSGIYFARLKAGDFSETMKMVLLK